MTDHAPEKTYSKQQLLRFAVIAFLLGILWFIAMRVVLYNDDRVHHHANFAVYISGDQETFSEPTFYEEVTSCGGDVANPLARVHMHDQISDVVHVHDASATWGNFFENIGFSLGDNVLYARTQAYVDGQSGELSFILNGEPVRSIASKTITSEDKLLVNFGAEDQATLQSRYDAIANSAAEYNQTADPAACSGSQGLGIVDKLKEVLGL